MSATAPRETAGAAAFPWDQTMALGFGVLRLGPAEFWAMTPRELARALAPLGVSLREPPTRAALDDLMRRFPDRR